ncbi:cell division protein FtsZ [Thiomicrorhabdus arctica]|jgi:cell division protein FtsZ|uniref:cell division protein FtsZ n=1 Tax=Thiomicrorhabdus arctica TaxID=131540 RepID=UPI00035FD21C|nr:cell division protein FtsZ [Thiomicrorhabdus arctica]
MKFVGKETTPLRVPGMPVIKVIGLGGGGGNAVDYMVRSDVKGVEFICANTDAQALANSSVGTCIQIGAGGLGAGADPERGRQAAKDDIEKIKEQLKGTDMVFITAGMGGGTGTGSAPVVAQAAREMGILTVGVVSKPFSFERRNKTADAGIEELAQHVDSLITVPNDKLLKVLGRDFVLAKAFDYANEVLHGAVQGISELVTRPGMINVDFEDLRTVMGERGMAMMGVGHATGEERAIKAAQKAIANPLLEDISVSGARGLLVNITSGLDFTLGEFNEVGDVIDAVAAPDARVIIGTSVDESMTDEIRVTVVATGLSEIASGKPELVKPNLQAVQANKTEQTVAAEVNPLSKLQAAPAAKSAPIAEMEQEELIPSEPEVVRPKMVVNGGSVGTMSNSSYLDIPAFLRRQAD